MYKPIIITTALSMLVSFVSAQNISVNAAVYNSAENKAKEKFNGGIGRQSRLYNGPEYHPYESYIKGNAYFNDSQDFTPATINFDGNNYYNVPLKYDLVKNLLTALYANNGSMYVLASERTKNFNLMGHGFKYISADTVNDGPGSGFYEQLYAGKISVLIKYSKTLQSSVADNMVDAHFTKAQTKYFIEKGTKILPFSSLRSLLSIFKDHKKQVQQYINANSISFNKQPEQAMIMIASYYDSLIN